MVKGLAALMLEAEYAQAQAAALVGQKVAEALFAPVLAALRQEEDEMVEAAAERLGFNDPDARSGILFQSAGWGHD